MLYLGFCAGVCGWVAYCEVWDILVFFCPIDTCFIPFQSVFTGEPLQFFSACTRVKVK